MATNTAFTVREALIRLDIEVMKWPLYSPNDSLIDKL